MYRTWKKKRNIQDKERRIFLYKQSSDTVLNSFWTHSNTADAWVMGGMECENHISREKKEGAMCEVSSIRYTKNYLRKKEENSTIKTMDHPQHPGKPQPPFESEPGEIPLLSAYLLRNPHPSPFLNPIFPYFHSIPSQSWT